MPPFKSKSVLESESYCHSVGISFVVAGLNRKELLLRCLNSIHANCAQPFQILYVDGGSSDGTLDVLGNYEGLQIVRGDDSGPGGNWNTGARYAQYEIIVFLDCDVEIISGWAAVVRRKFTDNLTLGVAGCKIISIEDRHTIQSAGQMILPGFIPFDRRKVNGWPDSEDYVFAVIGTALAVRKRVFNMAGKFDGDYYYGGEDTDLCWRVWLLGYKVMYLPTPVYHKGIAYRAGVHVRRPKTQTKSRRLMVRSTTKNNLGTFLKNGELKTVVLYLAPNILRAIIWGLSSGKLEGSLLGFMDFLLSMKSTVRKRTIIQAGRRVSDLELLQSLSVKAHIRPQTGSKTEVYDIDPRMIGQAPEPT